MNKLKWIVAFSVLFIAAVALASSGGGYNLSREIMANGGGLSSGGNYTLNGSIGQHVVSNAAGGNYTVQSGFWSGYAGIIATPTDEPTATATETATDEPTATATETATDEPTATEPGTMTVELARNGGFEDQSLVKANQADQWNFKKLSKDKRKCNTEEKTFSRDGDCAYLFQGSALERSQISQGNAGIVLPDGITLNASVYYRTNPTAPRVKMKLKVFYEGVEHPTVIKANINTLSQGVFTLFALDPYTLEEGTVTNIKFQFSNRAKSGKIFLDDASLTYEISLR
jgi:hypothetical protein